MTSNPQPTEYGFTITSADLEQGTLNRPGKVRVDKVFALAQSIAIRTFGRVNSAILERIRQELDRLTCP
jgi:hypothetical protein